MLREAVAAGTRARAAAKAVMEQGQLVGDDIIVGVVRERLAQAGRAGGLRARRVSADGAAGRGARRDRGRPRPAAWSSTSRSPDEELVRRLTSRRVCAPVRGERRRPRRSAAQGHPEPVEAEPTCAREVRRRADAARGRPRGRDPGAAAGLRARHAAAARLLPAAGRRSAGGRRAGAASAWRRTWRRRVEDASQAGARWSGAEP